VPSKYYFSDYSPKTQTRCEKQLKELKDILLLLCILVLVGRDSSVGIANRYGMDGQRIKSRWGREFPPLSRPALEPTLPPIQWVPGLSRGQSGRGVALTIHSI